MMQSYHPSSVPSHIVDLELSNAWKRHDAFSGEGDRDLSPASKEFYEPFAQ
jgi:hypothetical protein